MVKLKLSFLSSDDNESDEVEIGDFDNSDADPNYFPVD